MGNQAMKMDPKTSSNFMEQLCSLTLNDYSTPCDLHQDPFDCLTSPKFPSKRMNLPISLNVGIDQAQSLLQHEGKNEDTNHASMECQIAALGLQKNQDKLKQPNKSKKIKKQCKKGKREMGSLTSQVDRVSQEDDIEESIRNQNNCKSYHKLVKNYLIEQGLREAIDLYDQKYHTRYYFIIALILVKHYLKVDFTPSYESIVKAEMLAQQAKINKKNLELKTVRGKIQDRSFKGQVSALRGTEEMLKKQIYHIKIVQRQINDYSVRSCKAFFQGEIEESLKILYLKNDHVMKKKCYFEEALEIVTNLQFQMRKSHSHR